MNTFTPFIIFSAELADCGATHNEWRTLQAERELEDSGLHYQRVTGSYKGVTETAFLVANGGNKARSVVDTLADRFEQDSILDVDANRAAALVFSDGERLPVGTFKQVTEARALACDAWTRNDVTGLYYICE